jgi:hypothetical protein
MQVNFARGAWRRDPDAREAAAAIHDFGDAGNFKAAI